MSMNIYRLVGDNVHLISFFVIIFKIWYYKSCAGVSGKSQVLLSLAFIARYLDLFIFSSTFLIYNTCYKIIFLCLSYFTVFSIFWKFKSTYEKDLDIFRYEGLITVALIFALLFNYEMMPFEIFWSLSIYLEAIAMWPQFFMIWKTRKVTFWMFVYLSALNIYRTLYLANWIYKYEELHSFEPISFYSGITQIVPFYLFWALCCCKEIKRDGQEFWYGKNLTDAGVFLIDVPFDAKTPIEKKFILEDNVTNVNCD